MNDEIEIGVHCNHCHSHFELMVSESGLQAWEDGVLIQNALPELSAGSRELLISGTCDECWDSLFPDLE